MGERAIYDRGRENNRTGKEACFVAEEKRMEMPAEPLTAW